MSAQTVEMTAELEELRRKISLLPDDMVSVVSDFIDSLTDCGEEPLTEDELAQIEQAKLGIAAGDVCTWEEVKQRLADLP